MPLNATLAAIGHTAHFLIGYTLVAALVLHVLGALKHHLIDKDATLKRMLGAEVQGDCTIESPHVSRVAVEVGD